MKSSSQPQEDCNTLKEHFVHLGSFRKKDRNQVPVSQVAALKVNIKSSQLSKSPETDT